jgi:hypothetical protein
MKRTVAQISLFQKQKFEKITGSGDSRGRIPSRRSARDLRRRHFTCGSCRNGAGYPNERRRMERDQQSMVCAPVNGALARHIARGGADDGKSGVDLANLIRLRPAVVRRRPAPAQAAVRPVLYQSTANCEDCAAVAHTPDYIVHGQLVLYDAYVLGTTILPTEFVSFTYNGSNLYHSFTIDSEDLLTIFGALPSVLPGPPALNVVIISKYPFGAPGNNTFQINANGTFFWDNPPTLGTKRVSLSPNRRPGR